MISFLLYYILLHFYYLLHVFFEVGEFAPIPFMNICVERIPIFWALHGRLGTRTSEVGLRNSRFFCGMYRLDLKSLQIYVYPGRKIVH